METRQMTRAEFDRLSKRDFENGAVLDEIRASLAEAERLRAEHGELLEVCRLVICDVGSGGPSSDYVSAATASRVRAAIARAEASG